MHRDFSGRPNPSVFYLTFLTHEDATRFCTEFSKNPKRAAEYYLQTKLQNHIVNQAAEKYYKAQNSNRYFRTPFRDFGMPFSVYTKDASK